MYRFQNSLEGENAVQIKLSNVSNVQSKFFDLNYFVGKKQFAFQLYTKDESRSKLIQGKSLSAILKELEILVTLVTPQE